MKHTIRDYQVRVNSLGVLQRIGKPALVVDNITGSKTNEGIGLAKQFLNVKNNEDIFHPSGIKRIHWHWTAGSYNVTADTTSHYNFVYDEKGKEYAGKPVLDQARYRAGVYGASHTLMANTGAVGLSVAGMHGANVIWGSGVVYQGEYPLTWDAIDAMLKKTVQLCREYDIKPSIWTTLSHAEVEETLGIKQRSKWDLRVLPESTKLMTAKDCGDVLRERLLRFV